MRETKSEDPVAGVSRRSFLATAGTAGIVTAFDTTELRAQSSPGRGIASGERPGTVPISLRINGKEHRLQIDPRTTLLDCLRETSR